MDLDKITTKIQTEFIGSKYTGDFEVMKRLSEIVGEDCSCYYACIDHVADDEDIFRAVFDFEGNSLVVRIDYGVVTREIGYVDVSEM